MFHKERKYFHEVASEWLLIKKLSIKYSTYIKYETIINVHLNKYFENYLIHEITEEIIMNYFHELIEDQKLSISSMKAIRYVLKSVLDFAVERYKTVSINFKYIKLGKTSQNFIPLTPIQRKAIETHCFQHYDSISLVVLLSLYGGFRLGEVAGLKWEDVDFENGLISVNRTIERLKINEENYKTKLMILEPKSLSSKRIVPIPEFILEYMKKYLEINKNDDLEHYIYTNSHKISDPRNIQYHFKKLCELYDFNIHFHTLRHTYATNCVMNNIDIKSLSEMLGHSHVSITLDLYVHSSLDFKKEQINKIKKPILSQN